MLGCLSKRSHRRAALEALGLVGLSSCLIVYGLGTVGFTHDDEGRYAMMVSQMARDGDWLGLKLFNAMCVEKGPLLFWGGVVLQRILGQSELAIRIIPATCAIATVIAVRLLGATLVGARAAMLGAIVLCTTFPFLFIHGARAGVPDCISIFFATIAVLLFPRALGSPRRLALCAMMVGLAASAKHVAFVPFLLLPLGVFAVISGRWRRIRPRAVAVATATGVAVLLPWHVAEWIRFGDSFLDYYLGFHLVDRATTTTMRAYSVPYWAYFVWIKHTYFPWSLPMLFGLAYSFTQRARASTTKPQLCLGIFVSVVFLSVSVMETRYPWYLFVALPAWSLLTGKLLADACRPSPARWIVACVLASALIIGLLQSEAPFLNPFDKTPAPITTPHAWLRNLGVGESANNALYGVAALGGSAMAWLLAQRQGSILRWLPHAAVGALIGAALLGVAVPLRFVGRYTTCSEQAVKWMRSQVHSEERILLVHLPAALSFYAARDLPNHIEATLFSGPGGCYRPSEMEHDLGQYLRARRTNATLIAGSIRKLGPGSALGLEPLFQCNDAAVFRIPDQFRAQR